MDVVVEDATDIVGCTLTVAYPSQLARLVDGSVSSGFFASFYDERAGADPSQMASWDYNASTPGKILLSGVYVDQDTGLGAGGGPTALFTMQFEVLANTSGPFSIKLDETGLCSGPAGWGEDYNNNGAFDPGDEYEDIPVLYKATAIGGEDEFEVALESFAENPLKMFKIGLDGYDTDGDGIPDSVENAQGSCTSFTNPDSDGDGLWDGVEDKDLDGERDEGETDPCDADSDDDGVTDGDEDENKNGEKEQSEPGSPGFGHRRRFEPGRP